VLGKNYHADLETPILTAFWRGQRDCSFVEESKGMDGSGVFFFRNLHGRGMEARDLTKGDRLSSWPGSMPMEESTVGGLLRSIFIDKVKVVD